MRLYTIGFYKKSASQFFETLRVAGVARVVDVRLTMSPSLPALPRNKILRTSLTKFVPSNTGMFHSLPPHSRFWIPTKNTEENGGEYERKFLQFDERAENRNRLDPRVA
jgi:hypothetical protein